MNIPAMDNAYTVVGLLRAFCVHVSFCVFSFSVAWSAMLNLVKNNIRMFKRQKSPIKQFIEPERTVRNELKNLSLMIEFEKIKGSSDPLFTKMFELYRSAFPPSERRELGVLGHILDTEKRFVADALMKAGNFVGFFTYWTFGRFVYAEHFAVDPTLRGQNLGSETIQAFLRANELPVVLEVEMPDEPDAIRRIHFYERNGLKVVQQPYAQPYYDGSGRMLPMLLMTNDLHFVNTHFRLVKQTLYQEVYGVQEQDASGEELGF